MVNSTIREQVRQRANFACEFCGTSETDVGGQLTIDHFRPRHKAGDDGLENLIYCCVRCNQYKLDYWPKDSDAPSLWNPRQEPASQHFLELDDGTLRPLTASGAFTLRRLRLNRPALVAQRQRKVQQAEVLHLLTRYRDLMQVVERLLAQQAALVDEQQRLLEVQQRLLRLFFDT